MVFDVLTLLGQRPLIYSGLYLKKKICGKSVLKDGISCKEVSSSGSIMQNAKRLIPFKIRSLKCTVLTRVKAKNINWRRLGKGEGKECLKVHKHEIFFCDFFCRNRNHRVPRACNMRFLKIGFELAEIFDF